MRESNPLLTPSEGVVQSGTLTARNLVDPESDSGLGRLPLPRRVYGSAAPDVPI